jgi:RNA polymerase sigma-70 factor (ECF subfamily)
VRKPDQELVRQALAGNQAAYQELLQRHQKAIFAVVNKLVRQREEARDLVQETFMKAFGSLATYREEYQFSTWLHRIASNCAIDYIRKKKIEALSLDQPIQTKDSQVTLEVPDWSANPETEWVEKQRSLTIQEAIDSLPQGYKEVILYRHKEEKSYQEIAVILGIPVGTVKARIFRGRELLKKKLKAWRKGYAG